MGALYGRIAKGTPEAVAAAKQAAADSGSDLAEKIAGQSTGSALEGAQAVKEQLGKAEDAMHANYSQGMAQIEQAAKDIRVPIAGSALQNTAKEMLSNSDIPADIQAVLKGVVPDASKIEPLLKQFAGGTGDFSWSEMEGTRKGIGQTIRKLAWDSPIRADLIRLRGAIDQTMEDAAGKADNPDVVNQIKNVRSVYANQIQAFDSTAIKTLADKNPNAVANVLLNKQSVYNVNTLRNLIGAGNMKPVEGQLLQRLIDNSSTSGEFNPKSFVTKFNNLGSDVQKAIWGGQLPQLQGFLQKVKAVPQGSQVWGTMAKYFEHRATFDIGLGLITGASVFGAGKLEGHNLATPAAIIGGLVLLHSPKALDFASRAIDGLAKGTVPVIAGAAAEENS